MTMRNRQILVAVGLVILAAWFLFTWLGSSSTPEPTPTPGPSPTGGIGSAPLTFAPWSAACPMLVPPKSTPAHWLPPAGGPSVTC